MGQVGNGDEPVQLPVGATCMAWLLIPRLANVLVCVTNTYCPTQHHHNLIHDVERGNAGTSHINGILLSMKTLRFLLVAMRHMRRKFAMMVVSVSACEWLRRCSPFGILAWLCCRILQQWAMDVLNSPYRPGWTRFTFHQTSNKPRQGTQPLYTTSPTIIRPTSSRINLHRRLLRPFILRRTKASVQKHVDAQSVPSSPAPAANNLSPENARGMRSRKTLRHMFRLGANVAR